MDDNNYKVTQNFNGSVGRVARGNIIVGIDEELLTPTNLLRAIASAVNSSPAIPVLEKARITVDIATILSDPYFKTLG